MITGLPGADSLLASVMALRRKLTVEETGFRATTVSAGSADGRVTASVNGMVEALNVAVIPSAFPPVTLSALAASLKDACGKALSQANTGTRTGASADAAGYTLVGIPNQNQSPPATPGFTSSDDDLTAVIRAQDPIITSELFEGQSGMVSVVVDGTLALTTLTLTDPLPPSRVALEQNVVIALNRALDKAKRVFEDGVAKRVGNGVDSSAVTSQEACLYAHGELLIADRVKVKRQDNKIFASIVNAGAAQTDVGVEAQIGDLWSRASVEVHDRANVNGALRTMSSFMPHADVKVAGPITENGSLLQIPKLNLAVTFPATNKGDQEIKPDKQLELKPGAYGNVAVKSRATLFLATGTYFFNQWTVEPDATISCTSGSGQLVINVKGFMFHGSVIEKTGGRPKIFVGVFGSDPVSIESAFTGTLVALGAPVTLATVGLPGHSGAFYAKDITVRPDNTITHFPFSGPPTLRVT